MFTGIITAQGVIQSKQMMFGDGLRLVIQVDDPEWLKGVALGDSISHDGACLTVVLLDHQAGKYEVELSKETLACTTGLSQIGRIVNLEKALQVGGRLDGHLVTGHIDGVGDVLGLDFLGDCVALKIAVPNLLGSFVARKGSLTVSGVSLTVNDIIDDSQYCTCEMNLVPFTLEKTNLGKLKLADQVNLEIDLMARYAQRLLSFQQAS